MNSERTSTNTKVKQRKLQKTDILNKEDNTRYERGIEQKYGKPQKKRIKQKSWK
jgi:hypothetical protein